MVFNSEYSPVSRRLDPLERSDLLRMETPAIDDGTECTEGSRFATNE